MIESFYRKFHWTGNVEIAQKSLIASEKLCWSKEAKKAINALPKEYGSYRIKKRRGLYKRSSRHTNISK